MGLAPHPDSLRPMHLAARSTRLLGVLFVLIGMLTPVPSLRQGVSLWSLSPGMYVAILSHLVPGMLYVMCGELLRRRRRTGVMVAFGLAMSHTIIVVGNLAAYFQMLLVEGHTTRRLFLSLAVGFLVVAALAQLMWHLVKSFRVARPPGEPDELYFSEFDDDYDYGADGTDAPKQPAPPPDSASRAA